MAGDGAIRVLVADDQAAVRRGLRAYLDLQPDIAVVGEAADGEEAVELVAGLSPDVVLMDLAMPRLDGIGAAQRIRASHPQTKVLVLTSFTDEDRILPALGAGVAGYLVKDLAPAQLVEAIRAVWRDEPFLHPDVARRLMDHVAGDKRPEGTVTVLITDIEESTRMVAELGDQPARDLVREHERILREMLRQYGGSEVKHTGDGLMSVFAGARRAIGCAVAMQRGLSGEGRGPGVALRVRMGLNTGEAIREGANYFGETVILAARVAAAASGGEIFVSEATKALAEGAGFQFSDRGEHALKGIPQPRRLFEVAWSQS